MQFNRMVFFGDSLTYGQDSGGDGIDDPKRAYPEKLANMFGVPYVSHAKPGMSNFGINLVIKQELLQNRLHPTDLIIIGWTSVHREPTTLYEGHNDGDRHTVTMNVNYHDHSHPRVNEQASLLAQEDDWFLYERNENHIMASLALLRDYQTISFDMIFQLDYAPQEVLSRAKQNFCNFRPVYKVVNEDLGVGLSKSYHFYEDGYSTMAEIVASFVREKM